MRGREGRGIRAYLTKTLFSDAATGAVIKRGDSEPYVPPDLTSPHA